MLFVQQNTFNSSIYCCFCAFVALWLDAVFCTCMLHCSCSCIFLFCMVFCLKCIWGAVIDRSCVCVFQCIWLQHRADGQSSGQDGHPDRGSTRILRPSRWERTTEACVISPESVCFFINALVLQLLARVSPWSTSSMLAVRRSSITFTDDMTDVLLWSHHVLSLQLAWSTRTTGGIWESCSLTSTKSRLKVRTQIWIHANAN